MQLLAAEQWGVPPWELASRPWESLTPAQQAREKWRWLIRWSVVQAAKAEKAKRDLEFEEWRRGLKSL